MQLHYRYLQEYVISLNNFQERSQNYEKQLLVCHVCLSVCLSVHVKQLDSHWTDFHDIWYLSIFRKFVDKFQVSLKSDKNKGYFT